MVSSILILFFRQKIIAYNEYHNGQQIPALLKSKRLWINPIFFFGIQLKSYFFMNSFPLTLSCLSILVHSLSDHIIIYFTGQNCIHKHLSYLLIQIKFCIAYLYSTDLATHLHLAPAKGALK